MTENDLVEELLAVGFEAEEALAQVEEGVVAAQREGGLTDGAQRRATGDDGPPRHRRPASGARGRRPAHRRSANIGSAP